MTVKTMNMHLEHSFDNDKWRDENWVNQNARIRQNDKIKWTKEYSIDHYKIIKEMPFEIERIHFTKRTEFNTFGKFLHILSLTVGRRIKICSLSERGKESEINKWLSSLIPAGFSKYECIHMNGGACTLVLMRWRKG